MATMGSGGFHHQFKGYLAVVDMAGIRAETNGVEGARPGDFRLTALYVDADRLLSSQIYDDQKEAIGHPLFPLIIQKTLFSPFVEQPILCGGEDCAVTSGTQHTRTGAIFFCDDTWNGDMGQLNLPFHPFQLVSPKHSSAVAAHLPATSSFRSLLMSCRVEWTASCSEVGFSRSSIQHQVHHSQSATRKCDRARSLED
jgi:hypothetical protein